MKKVSPYLNLTRFYAFFIVTFLLTWIVFRYFTPLQINIRHTYELPAAACVNQLTSDYWTFEAVREGLMVLYILIPFSICLMIWSRETVGWGAHLAVVLVAMAWSIVLFGFDINDLKHANVDPTDINFRPENLARDPRWCLVHGGQPGTELVCANSGVCMGPAVDPNTFKANTPFLLRFIFNILLFAICVVALWSAVVWRRTVLSKQQQQQQKKPTTIRPRYATLK